MRVLLDENLPRRLRYLFPQEAEVTTVRGRGWDSIKNGTLLALADKEFGALLTADQRIPYQQDLRVSSSPWLSWRPRGTITRTWRR